MAKQSLKDPKFRCNACKEFYTAEENPVHYQCPKHGYLCEKHIINKDFSFTGREFVRENQWSKKPFERFEKEIHFPLEFIGCCHLQNSTRGVSMVEVSEFRYKNENPIPIADEQFINSFSKYSCIKKALKFNWNSDLKIWVEEGKEVPEKITAKSEKSNSSGEIKLLINLFETDILTKEQFLNQLKSII